MAVIQKIVLGYEQLKAKFKALELEAIRMTTPSVVVGFTAAYALPLHERVEMKWRGLPRSHEVRLGKGHDGKVDKSFVTIGHNARKGAASKGFYWGPHGQAKFLEQPAREMHAELGRVIIEAAKRTGDIQAGLLLAGLRLQRVSQDLVPILTGNLRASAFTRVEAHS